MSQPEVAKRFCLHRAGIVKLAGDLRFLIASSYSVASPVLSASLVWDSPSSSSASGLSGNCASESLKLCAALA